RAESRRRAAREEIREQRHGPPGRALLSAALRGCSRDVEVRPGEALGEAREETGRRDGIRGVLADVREIREVRLERVLVLVPERHVPGAVPCALAGLEDLARERVVVGKHA